MENKINEKIKDNHSTGRGQDVENRHEEQTDRRLRELYDAETGILEAALLLSLIHIFRKCLSQKSRLQLSERFVKADSGKCSKVCRKSVRGTLFSVRNMQQKPEPGRSCI